MLLICSSLSLYWCERSRNVGLQLRNTERRSMYVCVKEVSMSGSSRKKLSALTYECISVNAELSEGKT